MNSASIPGSKCRNPTSPARAPEAELPSTREPGVPLRPCAVAPLAITTVVRAAVARSMTGTAIVAGQRHRGPPLGSGAGPDSGGTRPDGAAIDRTIGAPPAVLRGGAPPGAASCGAGSRVARRPSRLMPVGTASATWSRDVQHRGTGPGWVSTGTMSPRSRPLVTRTGEVCQRTGTGAAPPGRVPGWLHPHRFVSATIRFTVGDDIDITRGLRGRGPSRPAQRHRDERQEKAGAQREAERRGDERGTGRWTPASCVGVGGRPVKRDGPTSSSGPTLPCCVPTQREPLLSACE